jgi:1,2-diacylglycerol 3-alpha-glucosyltransferase
VNIGIFTDTFVPQINGVVTVVRNLQEGLTKKNHNVYVFTVNHPKAKPMDNVFRVSSIKFLNEPQHRIGLPFSANIMKLAKKMKLDIIHTHTEFSMWFQATFVAKRYKIPIVHTMHTMYEEYVHYVPFLEYFAEGTIKSWVKMICKNAEAFIVPSQKAKEFLLRYNVYKPIEIIPNGVDLSKFYKLPENNNPKIMEFRNKYGISARDKVLIFVGRLGKEKDISTLLFILRKLTQINPYVKLLLVGDGPERKNLRSLSKEMEIEKNTIFTGYLSWPEEVSLAYNASDLAVVASHTESFGLMVPEAMACGLPVVAKNDPSFVHFIENGKNGFLCENKEKMTEVINSLINDDDKCSLMAEYSRHLAKKFSVEQNIQHTLELYKSII